ncbi:hypothetical protein KY289_016738 [Solanum tuberosum]|nr:hypothetical protein KY289_016738 [Solanum tuberosum]
MIKHYANTGGTIAAFDLPKDEHAPPSSPPTTSVEKKFEELVILIKENHSQLMRSRHKENNNVDPQSSNKQPFPHIRTDLPDAVGVADCEVGVSINEGGHQANVNAENLIDSHDLLSDSQLSIDIPTTEIVVRNDSKASAPRNRIPSRIIQSPYVTSFGSSEKGKEKLNDDVRLYFPFEGCGITYQASSKLIDDTSMLFITTSVKNQNSAA